ncbi:MAG: SGNH/GDSL hydrolase family protein [Anaerolineaceae bacterium]|nr:SGNH/GDSL hydrolase family protein [Anaerolineaceae bacterium]
MMKTILCYGDSNTWGAVSGTNSRLSIHERWPGVMRDTLGDSYWVIEEGLCGRTSIWVDQVCQYRTGRDYLLPCLDTHSPLDLVIIMLGTNDLKTRFHLPAQDIARGVSVLLEMTINSNKGPDGNAPEVLLIAPPVILDIPENQIQFVNGASRSKQFGNLFSTYAKQLGAHFLDAGLYVKSSTVDGIHLDAAEHKVLGLKVAQKVNSLLS